MITVFLLGLQHHRLTMIFFNMVNSINKLYVGATTAWPGSLIKILFTRKLLVYYLICVTYFEMKKRMSSVVCFEPGKVLLPHEEIVGPMVAVWIVPFLNGSEPHSNGYSGTNKRSYLYAENQTIEIVDVGSYNKNLKSFVHLFWNMEIHSPIQHLIHLVDQVLHVSRT